MEKSSLSLAKQHLLEVMQSLNFGRIENLQVRSGEPLFTKATKVVRKLRIGGENCPRPELFQDDFRLKQQAIELFDSLTSVKDGEILSIEIRHGLPCAAESLEGTPNREDGQHA